MEVLLSFLIFFSSFLAVKEKEDLYPDEESQGMNDDAFLEYRWAVAKVPMDDWEFIYLFYLLEMHFSGNSSEILQQHGKCFLRRRKTNWSQLTEMFFLPILKAHHSLVAFPRINLEASVLVI